MAGSNASLITANTWKDNSRFHVYTNLLLSILPKKKNTLTSFWDYALSDVSINAASQICGSAGNLSVCCITFIPNFVINWLI